MSFHRVGLITQTTELWAQRIEASVLVVFPAICYPGFLNIRLVTHKMTILILCVYVSQNVGMKINVKSAWEAKKLLYYMNALLLLLLLVYLHNDSLP